MHKTTEISTTMFAEKMFTYLLFLYPKQYRKKYGNEMFLLFRDMYQEELAKKGSTGMGFWLYQIGDVTKSIIQQHIELIGKIGMKKYLQQTYNINKYNIIGGIFLLPFTILLSLDLLARIVQGDLVHYNRAWYAAISHSLLYREPIILQIILIYAPILAILLNIIPLFNAIKARKNISLRTIFVRNSIAGIVVTLGLMFLIIIYGHDIVPCTIHGIAKLGLDSSFTSCQSVIMHNI